jgi:tetratricopeptide (TPR) repeat protein
MVTRSGMPPERHEVRRMKKQLPPARSKATTPVPVRHQLEHVVPTVIHNPEQDMTALGRLTYHVLQDPRKYSTWALTVLLGILALIFVTNYSSGGRSRNSEAWAKLEAAKKVDERVDVAKQFPNTTAATWALLQAASEYYINAFTDLPRNPEVALNGFKKSLDLFERVYREEPKDSFQARTALLGVARSLEARNDLAKAIEKYELITKSWPGTPEGEQAKKLAESLRNPDAASFYKQLYAYSPTKVTLPPSGSADITFPSTGINLPTDSLSVPSRPTPLIDMPLELAPPTAAERKKLEETKSAPAQPAAKGDAAKSPTPKTELPADVLAPAASAPKKK